MNILIADDHKFIVEDLMYELSELLPEAECTGTTRPDEVLSLFAEKRFEIVFMDIEMPGINGIQLAKKILADSPRTNIIYITGFTQYARECYRTYASAFLEKPITTEMLKDALDHLRFPISNITDEMIAEMYSGKAVIGKKIEKMREERGVCRQEFAEMMGVAGQTVYRWESGERVPDITTFMRIMKELGVDSEGFL